MGYEKEKAEIIFWGKELHRQGLLSGSSGNISWRVQKDHILMTAHGSYLGYLTEDDIVLVDLEGQVVEGKKAPTSETGLHLSIYRNFPEETIVLHAHSPYTVYFFHHFSSLTQVSFEERFCLGKVPVVPQYTPTVVDLAPVIEALKLNHIVVLKNHGVVAMGNDFRKVFSLIELLETQAKLNLTFRFPKPPAEKAIGLLASEKYAPFSHEHLKALINLVNSDREIQEFGEKFQLSGKFCLQDTTNKKTFCLHYQRGKITAFSESETEADFVISAEHNIWQHVFKGKIDPFAAVSQGKLKVIKGNFLEFSRWYPVFERIFALWQKIGIKTS
ncbi:MAG: class II aldolase/adducin family protein [Candidatus Desulfofervidaceae bacterium]|nr:class II aldolase/adducin family protein [Candidatus Desulfofervidaceae bacterium]